MYHESYPLYKTLSTVIKSSVSLVLLFSDYWNNRIIRIDYSNDFSPKTSCLEHYHYLMWRDWHNASLFIRVRCSRQSTWFLTNQLCVVWCVPQIHRLVRMLYLSLYKNSLKTCLVRKYAVYDPFIMFVCLAGYWELRQRIRAGICPRELVTFNGKDDWLIDPLIHCSIVTWLEMSMLRRSTDICVISGWKVVNIMFGHILATTLLYTNIREQFTWI